MCDLFSPYTPGAGSMPSYLAGREKNIQLAERRIEALQHGYPQSSIIYYGLLFNQLIKSNAQLKPLLLISLTHHMNSHLW